MTFWAPTTLNQIVGNTDALELLRAVIGNRDHAPTAFCFEGPHGTGKSTAAKLFLKQLCPDEKIAVIQPDRFTATLNQEDLSEYPCMIWDHAERLTKDQADQLSVVLDRSDLKTTFVFVTSEFTRVPQGIRARVLRIPFANPSQSDLIGLLGSICSAHGLNFELDALNLIASRTHGVPSQSIQTLHAVSLMGDITVPTVAKLQVSVEEQAAQLLLRIAQNQDPLGFAQTLLDYPTAELIDAMFTAYSRSMYSTDPNAKIIAERLGGFRKVGEVFIKWKGLESPPPPALFILVRELLDSGAAEPVTQVQVTEPALIVRGRKVTGADLDRLCEETKATGDL